MPKRLLDSALWRSDRLCRVEPTWMRAEYTNFLPLALANGVFEANPKRIWAEVYSYNRPDITEKDVEEILAAFQRAGMIFCWIDPATGKPWGFFVGIDKPGRLPPPSRIGRKHEHCGPEPPKEELQKFISQTNGEPMASQRPANGWTGSGSGSGKDSSSETGVPDEQPSKPSKPRQPSEAALQLAFLLRETILQNNPRAKMGDRQVLQWAVEADRMIRLDGRTAEEISEMIRWSQQDPFWSTNIISMGKLREKFDQLTLKRKREQEVKTGGGQPASQTAQEAEQKRQLTPKGKKVYRQFDAKVS